MKEPLASEWWCERLAQLLGDVERVVLPELKTSYSLYAAIARTEMEICAAIETIRERRV